MIAYLYLKAPQNGFYIDIGANNGLAISNTYVFEQMGWTGICVEANPAIFKHLKKYRKCDCRNVALSDKNGFVDFLKADAHLLSGINENISQEHRKEAEALGKVEVVRIEAITFNELMKDYPNVKHIDFMSIDVEGHEISVLSAIDFSKYSFGFITIENSNVEEIKKILETNGYKYFMELGADIAFVPKERH